MPVPGVLSSDRPKNEVGRTTTDRKPSIAPQGQGQKVFKDKNEKRREHEKQKRDERDRQEELKRQQEEQRKKGVAKMKSSVDVYQQKISKEFAGRVKIIKHSVNENTGVVTVNVELKGHNAVWMSVADFWRPENMVLYLPSWQKYCKSKQLPVEWRNNSSVVEKVGGQRSNCNFKQQIADDKRKANAALPKDWDDLSSSDPEPGVIGKVEHGIDHNITSTGSASLRKKEDSDVESEDDSDIESEDEPAVCYGHVLDKRGVVHMLLKWNDDHIMSRASVKSVMNGSMYERKKLGGTWIKYCENNGFLDELFCKKGLSVVQEITGHDWGDCGRPFAIVDWRHGEKSRMLVKEAMEPKTDINGFKLAWKCYGEHIGNSDESFQKGNINKEKKTKKTMKRRRNA